VVQPGVTAGVDGQPTAAVVSVVGRGELGAGGVTVDLRHQPPTPRFDGAALCHCPPSAMCQQPLKCNDK
jgi:hypothetical protein